MGEEHSDAEVADGLTPVLGLALSGGGVRASLFSLGVVVGLMHLGWNRHVRSIASVSGGSIVNAALAHGKPFAAYRSIDEFEPLASRLAASLASEGAFAFDARSLVAGLRYAVTVLVRLLPPLLLVLGLVLQRLFEDAGISLDQFPWSSLSWGWIAAGTAVWVVIAFLKFRGPLQEAKYRKVLQSVLPANANPFSGFRSPLYVRDWGAVDNDGAVPEVTHVLIATDLLSGKPMYFSNRFVYCEPYGWSKPEELRTVEALYSSAAFPIIFPPYKLKLGRLNFLNGEMPGPLPKVASLADGGVYNNLGTDWFRVLDERSDPEKPLLWPYGELELKLTRVKIEDVVVVNAGAPSESVRSVGFIPVARIMSVLYDNTVRPRVREIVKEARPLIDIAESPIELAQTLARRLGGEAKQRAEMLVEMLEGRSDRFWQDLKQDTSGTATKLTPAGRRAGARLMEHGYLSAMVLMHTRFGAALPEKLRGEKYFTELVTGARIASSEESKAADSG